MQEESKKLTEYSHSVFSQDDIQEDEDPEILFETMRLNGHTELIEFSQILIQPLVKVSSSSILIGSWLGVKVALKRYRNIEKAAIFKGIITEVERM